jgi:hypothetical protein
MRQDDKFSRVSQQLNRKDIKRMVDEVWKVSPALASVMRVNGNFVDDVQKLNRQG